MFNPIKTTTVTKSLFDIDLRNSTTAGLELIIGSCGNWWQAAFDEYGPSELVDQAHRVTKLLHDEKTAVGFAVNTGSNFDTNHWCFAVVAATELAIRCHADALSTAEVSHLRIEAYKVAKALWEAHGGEVPEEEVVRS